MSEDAGAFAVGRRYRVYLLGTKDSEGRADVVTGTLTAMDGPLITLRSEGRTVSVAGGEPVSMPGAEHVINVYSLGFIRADILDTE